MPFLWRNNGITKGYSYSFSAKATRPSTLTLDDYGGKAVHQKFWEVYEWLNALQFSFDFVCYF